MLEAAAQPPNHCLGAGTHARLAGRARSPPHLEGCHTVHQCHPGRCQHLHAIEIMAAETSALLLGCSKTHQHRKGLASCVPDSQHVLAASSMVGMICEDLLRSHKGLLRRCPTASPDDAVGQSMSTAQELTSHGGARGGYAQAGACLHSQLMPAG